MLTILPKVTAVDVLDILLVAVIVYWILLFIRGTRAVQILFGLLLFTGMFVLSRKIGMVTFPWIAGNVLGSLIVILVIVFQSEIRRGLAKMGQAGLFARAAGGPAPGFLESLAAAAFRLADDGRGAILLVERSMGLSEYVEHGRDLDALFSYEILAAVFSDGSPVHDGAVVLRAGRVAAAGVILPIPGESPVTRSMGTRHRAAWGVAVESDAVAIVVSEETGGVTVFVDGGMRGAADAAALGEILAGLFPGAEGRR